MKNSTDLGSIRVPINPQLIPAIRNFTGSITEMAGFSKPDGKKIQLAMEEACLNVIQHSFSEDDEGEYNVHFLKRLDGIEIHVHDMGLPYDPAIAPNFDPTADHLEKGVEGLGSYLISKTMDEYRFNNLGRNGKEMVMVKYFDTPLFSTGASVPVEPEVVQPPAPTAPVEQIPFDIRLMKPDEALEVCRCIYDCYGYSYANENIYFPERVAAMNQNGKLWSAVAITPDGEMGGHFALIFYDKLPPEIGIAVTKKKFRGQGFARQLGEYLELHARNAHLKGVQIKEVTSHPYTQKFCLKLGYKDCGILLAHSPKSLSFKGINENLKQRNSDVLGFKYLEPPALRKIFPPTQHLEMIRKLFYNIGDNVECAFPVEMPDRPEKSVTEVNVNALRSLAEIFILQSGIDIMQVMRHEMKNLFRDEIQVVELYLSLNDPHTPELVTQLEGMGFIFTGVLPETKLGDTIILQYFNGVYIDYKEIVLVTDLAKELMEYIRVNNRHASLE